MSVLRKTTDFHRADHYCAALDNEVGGFHVAETSCGGSEQHGVCGATVGHQFAANLRRSHLDLWPAEMISLGDDQPSGSETSLDVGGGVNRQRTHGVEFAEKFAFDDGGVHHCFGVEDITLFFNDESTMGL